MNVRKLVADWANPDQRRLALSLAFDHEAWDIGDAVLKARMIQSFQSGAGRYPIHRSLRYASRRPLAELFDALALDTGLAAQRLDTGSLVLEGCGAFVRAQGKRVADYCSCIFEVWTESLARLEEIRAAILRVIGERRVQEQMFTIDWHFGGSQGALASASFEEICADVLYDEAYPTLGEPVQRFIQRYLDADATVLILHGPPGTGKTRLVRGILMEMSRRKGESARVMYTADKRALESDEIFVEFITGSHDAFVIEDADHLLVGRARGNQDLHRFLAVADGVVRAQGRKIIFTTNLPNVGDIDEALLRPGRCFADVRTRLLDASETARLIAQICARTSQMSVQAFELALPPGSKGASIAAIYRACKAEVPPQGL